MESNTNWTIIYYEISRGDSPIYDFIESLNNRAKAKVYYTFSLLKEFGIKLGKPHIKKLTGTELWELRILGRDSIRILYGAVSGKQFLLLHGFIKKKMAIDKKDLRIAQKRLQDYLNK